MTVKGRQLMLIHHPCYALRVVQFFQGCFLTDGGIVRFVLMCVVRWSIAVVMLLGSPPSRATHRNIGCQKPRTTADYGHANGLARLSFPNAEGRRSGCGCGDRSGRSFGGWNTNRCSVSRWMAFLIAKVATIYLGANQCANCTYYHTDVFCVCWSRRVTAAVPTL